MRLEILIPTSDLPPDDHTLLAAVHATIAAKAITWTEPVFLGEQDGRYRYATDAQPKPTSIVTTANIAPALLPPHIT